MPNQKLPVVLAVEDAPDFHLIFGRLLSKNCELIVCPNIAEAQNKISSVSVDLILLDLDLPDGGGMGFYARLLQETDSRPIPVIFVTGNHKIDQKIQAFGLGAEDYITKPFQPDEFKARILAKLKKITNLSDVSNELTLKNLSIDLLTHRVRLNSHEGAKAIDLSSIEFRILVFFSKNIDRVFTRGQIIEKVWGENIHIYDRTLDTHLSHLRSKLKGAEIKIESVRGEGYRLSV